jgi:hypothetical protein
MRRAINKRRHVGLRDDIRCGFTFLMVAARGNEPARVVGQMDHEFTVANGVGTEAADADEVRQRWWLGCNTWVEVAFLVCMTRIDVKGVLLGC